MPPSIAQVAADRFREKVLRLFGLDREARDARRVARGRRHLQQGAEEVGMTFEEAEAKGLVNWVAGAREPEFGGTGIREVRTR